MNWKDQIQLPTEEEHQAFLDRLNQHIQPL